MTDLAKRLLACPRFRWMPGMRTVCGVHLHEGGHNSIAGYRVGTAHGSEGIVSSYWVGPSAYLPDLTDPATLGCLLALVREAHKEATIHVVAQRSDWDDIVVWHVVSAQQDRALGTGDTEAEALVAALEAA